MKNRANRKTRGQSSGSRTRSHDTFSSEESVDESNNNSDESKESLFTSLVDTIYQTKHSSKIGGYSELPAPPIIDASYFNAQPGMMPALRGYRSQELNLGRDVVAPVETEENFSSRTAELEVDPTTKANPVKSGMKGSWIGARIYNQLWGNKELRIAPAPPPAKNSSHEQQEKIVVREVLQHNREAGTATGGAQAENSVIQRTQDKRLSIAQIERMKRHFGHGTTMRKEARKHIVERWTHTFLVTKLCILIVFSIILIAMGAISEPLVSGRVVWISGVLLLISSALGIHGAKIVVREIEFDDDGVETPGQRMLQIYFHIALSFLVLFLPFAINLMRDPLGYEGDVLSTVFRAGDSLLVENAEKYLRVAGAIGLCTSIIISWSLRSVVKIVTFFEITQSFLEIFSLTVIGLGIMLLALLLSFYKQTQFMSDSDAVADVSGTMGSRIALSTILLLLIIGMSIIGFFAAWLESKTLLLIHAVGISVLGVMVLAYGLLVVTVDWSTIIDNRCYQIVKTMSDSWWKDTVLCTKYGGTSISALVENYDIETGSYFYMVNGPGLAARCKDASQYAVAWEYSATTYANRTTFLVGCVDLSCCDKLSDFLSSLSFTITFAFVLLVLSIFVVAIGDLWLRRETQNDKGRVKVFSRTRGFWILTIAGLICVVSISVLTTFVSGEMGRNSADKNLSPWENVTVGFPVYNISFPHSCANSLLDGNETDIDCGSSEDLGGCKDRCSVGRTCREDSDCLSDLYCSGDKTCQMPSVLTCTDGKKNLFETDIDCGGTSCQGCANGLNCKVSTDCFFNNCEDGKCVGCTDGIKNAGETDVDCGSTQCTIEASLGVFSLDIVASTFNYSGLTGPNGLCLSPGRCSTGEDCESGNCVDYQCVSCFNNAVDGDETDTDCGGENCAKRCPTGWSCLVDDDCQSGNYCNDNNYLCTSIGKCNNDSTTNNGESDVDCGGDSSGCPRCVDGQICLLDRDCESQLCYDVGDNEAGVCTSCGNGVKDGDEGDIDCGGSQCNQLCAQNQTCNQSSDCKTGLFCWTDYSRNAAVDHYYQYYTNSTETEFDWFPPVDTCQTPFTLSVTSLSPYIAILENVGYGELFVSDMSNVFDISSASTSSTRRRLIAGGRAGNRRLQDVSSAVSAGYPGSMEVTNNGSWPFLCNLTVKATSDNENVFFEMSETSSKVTFDTWTNSTPGFIAIIHHNDEFPEVYMKSTQCENPRTSQVTSQWSVDANCDFLNISSSLQEGIASIVVPYTTTITGLVNTSSCIDSIYDSDCDVIPDASITVREYVSGTCKKIQSPSTSASCENVDCKISYTYYHQCVEAASQDNPCCYWWDDDEVDLSGSTTCLSGSNASLSTSSGVDGAFTSVIPELYVNFSKVDLSKTRDLLIEASHDGYETQYMIVDASTGVVTKAGTVYLVPLNSPTQAPTPSPGSTQEPTTPTPGIVTETASPTQTPTVQPTATPTVQPTATPTPSQPIFVAAASCPAPEDSAKRLQDLADEISEYDNVIVFKIEAYKEYRIEIFGNLLTGIDSLEDEICRLWCGTACTQNSTCNTEITVVNNSSFILEVGSYNELADVPDISEFITDLSSALSISLENINYAETSSMLLASGYPNVNNENTTETSVRRVISWSVGDTAKENVMNVLDQPYDAYDTCSVSVVPCLGNLCSNRGTCNNATGLCECETGYYGYQCQLVEWSEFDPFCVWKKAYSQQYCTTISNINEASFNSMFSESGLVRYDRFGTPYAYYRRLSDPSSFNAYSNFLETWDDESNEMYQDFVIYSTQEDLYNTVNEWTECNYGVSGRGFPGQCGPEEINFYKWCSRYCADQSLKSLYQSSATSSFALYICDPVTTSPPGTTYAPSTCKTFGECTGTIAGHVVDELGLPVEASISLLSVSPSSVKVARAVLPDKTTSTEMVSSDQNSTITRLASLELSSECRTRSTTSSGMKSIFNFDDVDVGMYTLLIEPTDSDTYDPKVLNNVEFRNENVTVLIPTATNGSRLTVNFAYDRGEYGDLELVVNFLTSDSNSSTPEECSIGISALSDGGCECGGVKVLSIASNSVDTNGRYSQTLVINTVYATVYRFFIRAQTTASQRELNELRLYRTDGRCGSNYPLENGQASQCPTEEILWDDGTIGTRPCCSQAGYCGSAEDNFCTCSLCMDYNIFERDDWESLYRYDGACRDTSSSSDPDVKAICPPSEAQWWDSTAEARPCCNDDMTCGNTVADCSCPTCVDYRTFVNQTQNGIDDYYATLLEDSNAVVTVTSADGTTTTFNIPELTELNFQQSSNSSLGPSFARLFCISATSTQASFHEYGAPRYFSYESEMLALDIDTCPGASSSCNYVYVTGITNNDTLNGVYYLRSNSDSSTVSYNAYPGYYVAQSGIYKTKNVQKISTCINACDADDTCEGFLYQEVEDYPSYYSCSMFADLASNLGMLTTDDTSIIVYVKSSGEETPTKWYTKVDTLMSDKQIHLYRDDQYSYSNILFRWFFDDNLVSDDGYYAYGADKTGTSPSGVSQWWVRADDSTGVTYILPESPSAVSATSVSASCELVNPTVTKDFSSLACTCTNTFSDEDDVCYMDCATDQTDGDCKADPRVLLDKGRYSYDIYPNKQLGEGLMRSEMAYINYGYGNCDKKKRPKNGDCRIYNGPVAQCKRICDKHPGVCAGFDYERLGDYATGYDPFVSEEVSSGRCHFRTSKGAYIYMFSNAHDSYVRTEIPTDGALCTTQKYPTDEPATDYGCQAGYTFCGTGRYDPTSYSSCAGSNSSASCTQFRIRFADTPYCLTRSRWSIRAIQCDTTNSYQSWILTSDGYLVGKGVDSDVEVYNSLYYTIGVNFSNSTTTPFIMDPTSRSSADNFEPIKFRAKSENELHGVLDSDGTLLCFDPEPTLGLVASIHTQLYEGSTACASFEFY